MKAVLGLLAVLSLGLVLVGCDGDYSDTSIVGTPTATITPQEHAYRAVMNGAPSSDKIAVTYVNGVVTVTDTMDPDVASKDWILEMGYDEQKSVWTSLLHPQSVTINFMGPVQDKYGRVSTALYASETLTAPTAAKFVWNNLTYQQAWDAFDQTWMRPDVASQ